MWLRKMTGGKGVRALEADFSYSTTSWSEFRSGSRLLPERLLREVVEKYIREPQMSKRQLAEGLRLLEAARTAEAVLDNREAPPSLPMPGPQQRGHDAVSQALLRLDDARLRQIEAMQKLAASERRRLQLEDMVSVLQERCTLLTSERDRAREDSRADFERELQMSLEYRLQADEKLDHARRAEEKAYLLRRAAEQQVLRAQLALRRIGETVTDLPAGALGIGPDELDLPPLDQIHDVLQAAQEQLDAQDSELSDLEALLGHDVDGESPPSLLIVPGQLRASTKPNSDHPQLEQEDLPSSPVPRAPIPDRTQQGLLPPEGSSRVAKAHKPPPVLGPARNAVVFRAELLAGLVQVGTQDEFAAQLRKLRAHAHTQVTDSRLAEIAFGLTESAVAEDVLRSWFAGETLPQRWRQLHPVLTALGADLGEVSEFHRAWTAVGGGSVSPVLVAALHPFMSLQRLQPDPLGHTLGWIIDVVGLLLMTALSAAFAAAFEADPGPPVLELIFWGAGLLALEIGLILRKRAVFGLYAITAGIALTNAPGGGTVNRWLASTVGLI
ncbi:tropomyosin (plasmid) [Streptomyces sp. NBC_01232]|uniref:hypothetical protein n=1 Tax=Streptomyces sp. NBC_01232 TaxID=2903786 RepID=UPI002E13C0DB|nr:tropomyosin [Streptomyces sp. NBC_01232]